MFKLLFILFISSFQSAFIQGIDQMPTKSKNPVNSDNIVVCDEINLSESSNYLEDQDNSWFDVESYNVNKNISIPSSENVYIHLVDQPYPKHFIYFLFDLPPPGKF